MTEQPTETGTEQGWLGNKQAYLPGGHRLPSPLSAADIAAAELEQLRALLQPAVDPKIEARAARNRMLLEAEQHAADGTSALSSGELDEGIAYLQSALAFALNYRHAVRFGVEG